MDHQAIAQLLGNYGEFVGAIAVVVTLGYLAAQVRQNSKSLDASTSQELLGQINSLNISMIGSREAIHDWYDYLGGGDNKGARARGEMVLRCMMNNYLQAYLLHQRGALQEPVWENIDHNTIKVLSYPGGRYWLESSLASDLPSDFKNHIAQRLGSLN